MSDNNGSQGPTIKKKPTQILIKKLESLVLSDSEPEDDAAE